MSKLSNNKGRGYEYACLYELYNAISEHRAVEIVKNSSYTAAKRAYATLTDTEKRTYCQSAIAIVPSIFECEPRMIEQDSDTLELYIQHDEEGEKGDVRDIIIARSRLKWEIGLSIKHNHFAVKHNRLSPTIDFGDKWFGYPCSKEYWKTVLPIFDDLKVKGSKGVRFDELKSKQKEVYIPILTAFADEIKRQSPMHRDMPQKMVEYLLSKYDFYKIISLDKKHLTQIQAFNTHNTLNESAKNCKATIIVPHLKLPNRIIGVDIVPNRMGVIEISMNGGWSFTFRIHNADRICVPSLKFDIQLIGIPSSILIINCIWK